MNEHNDVILEKKTTTDEQEIVANSIKLNGFDD